MSIGNRMLIYSLLAAFITMSGLLTRFNYETTWAYVGLTILASVVEIGTFISIKRRKR